MISSSDVIPRFTRCLATGEPQRSLQEWHSPAGAIFALRGLCYLPGEVDRMREDIGRYRAFIPLADGAMTLGTGDTPLHAVTLFGHQVLLKDERANPMGSFKDRGMCVLANLARGTDGPVFVDSVGNTAAALAGFSRALGLDAHVFAPLRTSPERAEIVRSLGGRLHLVAGPRAESGKVAIAAAESGALYLSHIYHPLFQAGTATCAFEIYEQLGPEATGARRALAAAASAHRRPFAPLPDRVFLAVGQGSLFLGLWHGFRALLGAGVIDALPRLYAVRPVDPATTRAVGSSSPYPIRAQEIRNAAQGSGGETVLMPESALDAARAELQANGWHADPAAALALAGWREIRARDGEAVDVVILTGADRERGEGSDTP